MEKTKKKLSLGHARTARCLIAYLRYLRTEVNVSFIKYVLGAVVNVPLWEQVGEGSSPAEWNVCSFSFFFSDWLLNWARKSTGKGKVMVNCSDPDVAPPMCLQVMAGLPSTKASKGARIVFVFHAFLLAAEYRLMECSPFTFTSLFVSSRLPQVCKKKKDGEVVGCGVCRP